MKDQTLKELRARAKAQGLKGYSRMAKDALVRALGKPAAQKEPAAPVRSERRAHARSTEALSQAASSTRTEINPSTPSAPKEPTRSANETPDVEEMVETAKYVTSPVKAPVTRPPAISDLVEDIDRLPDPIEPFVCLLAQKPGILYAYWRSPPEESGQPSRYMLRLARLAPNALDVYEEFPVRSERGNWYFRVDENLGGRDMVLQLGYYRDGRFITAQGQSVARLPSLYASTRTDHRWWVSEQEFASMYLRAGGVAAGKRYQWFASTGSPTAPPGAPGPGAAPEERLRWPGGVSSR